MKPIIVISINNGAQNLLETLGKEFNLPYFNAETKFDKDLLDSAYLDDNQANLYLLEREQALLKSLAKMTDCLISVPADMFLSNKAYKNFEKSITVFFEHQKLDEMEQKIQKFITDKVNYSLSGEKRLKELISKLIKK